METPPLSTKRHLSEDNEPPLKKQKSMPEIPAQYSEAVRKKLASTTRTGQACDRCKERKMKCDTNPIACQPCRSKGLRCFTTDRVTGQARERGQSDRTENELQFLREQLAAYEKKYGLLQEDDLNNPQLKDSLPQSKPLLSNSIYDGWPSPPKPIYSGPVQGTLVDVFDGVIDVADFECEMMEDYPSNEVNRFNLSRTSITNTICGYQRVVDPRLPTREEALRDVNHWVIIMLQYAPVVHSQTLVEITTRLYDQPTTVSIPERVQVIVVLAIMAHQIAVRNYSLAAEKFEDSHRWLHYGLSFYRDLIHDTSLASMQALLLIVLHFRNLPKPGFSWNFAHQILVRAIELNYHRDPERISLPPEQNNLLSKELRKRIFHSIIGVCATTSFRVGISVPQIQTISDITLPLAIKDSEISVNGIVPNLSGDSDFRPAIQLAKLLPLLKELYYNIITVRHPPTEYCKIVESLNAKVIAWRQEWDESIKSEPGLINLTVAGLLFDGWMAEFQLNLHHPVCCTSTSTVIIEKNLDLCHKAARKLLQSFHTLSNKYKGVDFTWHSTAAYAMGFGITLHIYRRKKTQVTREHFETIMNELNGWMSLMAYADLVLRTGNHLQRIFQPRVRSLEEEYRALIINSTPNGNHQSMTPSFQHTNSLDTQPSTESEPNIQMAKVQASSPQTNGFLGQVEANTSMYTPHTSVQKSQAWPTSYQYIPETSPPTYSVYSQSPSQYQNAPSSLAALLNDPRMQMGYATVPAQTPSNVDAMMAFSPDHYYDGSGPINWPLITLPPNLQQ